MKKKKDIKLIIVIILATLWTLGPVIFVTLGIFLSNDFNKKYDIQSDGSIKVEKDEILIKGDIKHYYDEADKTYYVEGYLVNLKKEKMESVNIQYKLYDVSNNVIGEAVANISNLESKETWKFKATYSDIDANKIVKIKFSNISY